MGRMLDALSRNKGRLLPSSRQANVVPEAEPEIVKPKPVVEGPADDDSIPFIEVGGPTTRMQIPNAPVAPTPSTAPVVATVPSLVTLVPIPKLEPKVEPEPIHRPWFAREAERRYLSVLYHPTPDDAHAAERAFADELIAHHKPDHPISVQYRSLWKEMAEQLTHPHQALLFTSIHDQSGTTTVGLNLAVTILREPGKQVLVIDANSAQPAVASRLGLAASPGLHELLHRGLPSPLSIHRTPLAGLSVMVSGYGEGNRGPVDKERLARLLAQLRSRYDWVVIDSPAWGDEGMSVWAELCDASFLVLRQSDSDHPNVEPAHELLHREGKLRGYLMTRN